MTPPFHEQQQQQQQQRGGEGSHFRELGIKGRGALTSGDHRRHSCPDLLPLPRGINDGHDGGIYATTPAGPEYLDASALANSVEFSTMVEVPETTTAVTTFGTNGAAACPAKSEEAEGGKPAGQPGHNEEDGPIFEEESSFASKVSDGSDNDVAETVFTVSGSGSGSTRSSSGDGFSAPLPPTKPVACVGDTRRQEDPDTPHSTSYNGGAEICPSSTSSSSSSSFSSSSSSTSTSTSFVEDADARGVAPLQADQTATSVALSSPSGGASPPPPPSSEGSGCGDTKKRRPGRGCRPSDLLAEEQQQKQKQQKQPKQQPQQGVGDLMVNTSECDSGEGSGILLPGCRIGGSGHSTGSSATLIVGAPEPSSSKAQPHPDDIDIDNDEHQRSARRPDSNPGLWGYWSDDDRGKTWSSRSSDSVTTASYGAEERPTLRSSSPPNGRQAGTVASAVLHDRWLSFQEYSPVPIVEGKERVNSSGGLEKRHGDRFCRVVDGFVDDEEGPFASPKQQGRLPLSNKSVHVLKLVDVNAAEPARTPRGARIGRGGEGSGSKRTPEEQAYLRRAGIENFGSNTSSVENIPAGRRLATEDSAVSKSAAEDANSSSLIGAPGSPTGSVDTASGSPLPSAVYASSLSAPPVPSSSLPKDRVSSLSSSHDGGSVNDPPKPFFGAADTATAAGAGATDSSSYSDREDDGDVGTQEEKRSGEGDEQNEDMVVSQSSSIGERHTRSVSDDPGPSQPMKRGGGQRLGGRRGSSGPRQEGGVWIDFDGTPMGRVRPHSSLNDVLHQHCPRNNEGLRPLKKSISEAGGLGSYLATASSTRVSAVAAAEASKAALADALDNIFFACFEAQASPRAQPPPLSPSYSYVGQEALETWGEVPTE